MNSGGKLFTSVSLFVRLLCQNFQFLFRKCLRRNVNLKKMSLKITGVFILRFSTNIRKHRYYLTLNLVLKILKRRLFSDLGILE